MYVVKTEVINVITCLAVTLEEWNVGQSTLMAKENRTAVAVERPRETSMKVKALENITQLISLNI
jgi:hypothetical protein